MGRFKNEINNRIQDELNKIRYYYSYRDVLVQASKFCGENEIVEKIRMYNSFIVKAPIRLYHLYYEFLYMWAFKFLFGKQVELFYKPY